METVNTKLKVWIGKAVQCVWTILAAASNVMGCFRYCHQQYLDKRQCRRRNRQTASCGPENIKIVIGDSPGIFRVDEFCRKSENGSSGTPTEESASDDSLLGSPAVEQRMRDGKFSEVALKSGHKSYELTWISEKRDIFEGPQDDAKSASDHSTNTISSTCRSSGFNSDYCDELKKLNEQLHFQIEKSNEKILALELQLSELKNSYCETTLERIAQNDSEVIIESSGPILEILQETQTNLNKATYFLEVPTTSNLSLPPPPPPLPLSWNATSTGKSSRKKSVPASSCALKTLNWIKLKEDSLVGTIWHGLEDEKFYSTLDLKEIDRHFTCASNHDAYGTIRSRMSVCSTIREISVLDGRRAQNCAILLSKLKLSDKEICSAVMTMDTNDQIPKDMAEQLLKFIPTADEIALLLPYTNSKESLHPADRFFIEIASVKRYEQRLRCLCFKKLFTETAEETGRKLSTISTASKRFLASKRLQKLLGAILAIGNYINQSKRSSDAFGFHLSALTLLQDVKSSLNGEYTLLHFLVELCQKSVATGTGGFFQEIAICIEAAKISGLDVQFDINRLKEGLKLLDNEIASSKAKDNNHDSFFIIAKSLQTEYKEKFTTLEECFTEMKTSLTRCCKAYAPEEHYHETLNVSEFFGYFAQFLNQFKLVETQLEQKRREQETRTLTLTRVKGKRQLTVSGDVLSPYCNKFDQRTRRSGRISKKAVTDINEELLTSVLMAMDQRRGPTSNEVFLCGRRHRRSFRLSTKRKQMKLQKSNSPHVAVVRRRPSNLSQEEGMEIEDDQIKQLNSINLAKAVQYDALSRER